MEPNTKKTNRPFVDLMDPAMVLTGADLEELGRSLHTRITNREELFAAVASAASVSVEGVPISLELKLLSRLKSRCLDKEHFPRWLSEVIIRQLHDYAGW